MTFSTDDTIVAIATPPGRGGIGIVRISGTDAAAVAGRLIDRREPLTPRRATFSRVQAPAGAGDLRGDSSFDQVVVTYFPAPKSYTGDDVVELSAHGSPVVLKAIIASALAAGARLAQPGEFTLRAFLNGRIDLTQAEAVGDLIDAVTPLQARSAFDQLNGTLTTAIETIDRSLFDLVARLEASVDFPEEGYHFVEPAALAEAIDDVVRRVDALLADGRRGRVVREGLHVGIIGPPNVGKSSLFNALVGAARAIVAPQAGTTRDLVTETIDLEGLKITLVDTAGLRDTGDAVEAEGVSRSRATSKVVDLVLAVIDVSRPRAPQIEALSGQTGAIVWVGNKADLPKAWSDNQVVSVSARTGAGLDELRAAIARALDVEPLRDRPAITNVRHLDLLERVRAALARARAAAWSDGQSLSEEFVLADLQTARQLLDEVVGRRTSEDILRHIFEKFCIGK